MATGDIDLCPLSCDGQISSGPTDLPMSRPFFEPNEQLQLLTSIPACGQKNAIGSHPCEQIERFPLTYPNACSVPKRQTVSRLFSAARSADLTISTRSTSTVHPLQVFGFCRIIPNDAQSGWRAIVFCYFESIIRSMNRSNMVEEIARIRSFGFLVEAAGKVDSWLYEKTAGETINFLKELHNSVNCPLQSRADLLMRRFNDTKISNSIIFHLRLISSLWAAAHAQTYERLLPDGVSLDAYRKKTLEAHNGQLDILGAAVLVDWLLNPIGIKLNIVTLGGKGLFTTLDEHLLTTRFAQSVSSVGTCHLLYRFDHYDILYTQDYSGIDGNGGTITCKRARPLGELKEGKPVESPPTLSISSALGFKSRYETNTTERYDHLDLMVQIFQMPTHTGIKTLITDAAIDVDSHPSIEFKIQNSSENKTHPDNASRKRVSSGRLSRVRLESRNTHVLPRYRLASDSSLEPSVHEMSSSEIDQNLQVLKALNPVTASMDISNFDRVNDAGSEDEEDEDAECENAELESNFNRIWTSLEIGYCIGQDLLEMVLERNRIQLLEGILEQFWKYVKQRMGGGIRKHADPSSTSRTATSDSLHASTRTSNLGSGKRSLGMEDEGQGFPEEDDERRAKKPRTPAVSRDALEESAKFACPYRKYDPRKYNWRDWRTCVLTPLRTVARVKAHLYRHHTIHQCQRCNEVFESQETLTAHVNSPKACDVRPSYLSNSVEGINSILEKKLRCRKKAYPGQTEAERWQKVYQLIFPDEKFAPSPYFEAIRDGQENGPQSPDLEELGRYEQYLRTEIPRCFKRALESAIDNEICGVGDRLRDRLFTLLQEAQGEAFGMYRADQIIDAEMVPTSSQPGQNSDDSGGNEDNIGLRVRQEFQDSLQTGHHNKAQDRPESLRSTLCTFNPTVHGVLNDRSSLDDLAEGFELENSETSAINSTFSETDSVTVKDPVETTSNQNVAVQQFEPGSSNYSYDHWPFPESLDSDLFDLNPQLGANSDIRA